MPQGYLLTIRNTSIGWEVYGERDDKVMLMVELSDLVDAVTGLRSAFKEHYGFTPQRHGHLYSMEGRSVLVQVLSTAESHLISPNDNGWVPIFGCQEQIPRRIYAKLMEMS